MPDRAGESEVRSPAAPQSPISCRRPAMRACAVSPESGPRFRSLRASCTLPPERKEGAWLMDLRLPAGVRDVLEAAEEAGFTVAWKNRQNVTLRSGPFIV